MLVRLKLPVVDGPTLEAALVALVAINGRWLASHGAPPLYKSGVRYRRERKESWDAIPVVLARKWGDCEDLASWRVAELRRSGEPARVAVLRTGAKKWHAVVRRGDGRIEDPSRLLGMHAPKGAP